MDSIEAAIQGDLMALMALRASGRDVLCAGDPAELTTLHWACGAAQMDVVEWLLVECGADVRAKRNNAFTPLHSAAMRGHTEVVTRLLDAGADPDAQTDPQRYAPLHSAAFAGHLGTVLVLVARGARTDLRNYRGETPADTAARQGQQAVVEALRR